MSLGSISSDYLGPLNWRRMSLRKEMHIEKGVPATFKVEEVAKILNCSRSQVYTLLKNNQLQSVRIRGSRRVTENQLVRFIKDLEE
jgi:excisionase family DNA binding protein